MSKFYRGKIFVGLGAVFILALVLHGCSVSRVAKDTWKSLVEKDAPVFDKRFKEVSSQDINLQNFWTEGVPVEDRKPDRLPYRMLSNWVMRGKKVSLL